MSPRAHGHGVRKVCRCGWRRWPKCGHAWYFSYKPRGGPRQRFSLDAELNQHVESKSEAERLATNIRSAVNAGTFRRAADTPPAPPAAPDVVTLDTFAPIFIERAAQASGKTSWKDDEYLLATVRDFVARDGRGKAEPGHDDADGRIHKQASPVRGAAPDQDLPGLFDDKRRLGEWALSAVTEDELEAFHAAQRAAGRAASTLNHQVQVLKAAFRWAAKKGYLAHSPLSDDSALKRTKVAQRRRRISPEEEAALLVTAGALTRGAGLRLQWLVIAAIEIGARLGELLSLMWADVNLDKHTVLIRAVETGAKKTGRSRRLPMSARLAAVFEMAKVDPAGRRYPPTAYVFGALGERIFSVDKAWQTCVLRAHRHEPTWTHTGALTPESRQALNAVDLHFNDLRHEAGCRWLEAGWPIHHVREMLGHANLSQTSTYLHASELGLEESMKRFDGARGKPVAKAPPIEHRPDSHSEESEPPKDLLH